jgi:fructose-bisphosphate aldolase class II
MPLVTSKAMLARAYQDHYAVGAFNANNMEQVQAVIEAAEEERAPVILQVSQGAIRYCGLAFAAGLVKIAAAEATVPVVLHLDHGTDFEQNVRCLQAGFTSLMFDGSKLPFDQNVAITRKIVEIAHPCGIPVEAELGKVLQAKDSVSQADVEHAMTDPLEARQFVDLTGCDSLAVAVGSVHAMRAQEASLDIARVEAIRQEVTVPLVLHGSSGVTEASIVAAIEHGIAKVNVATYLNEAFVDGMRRGLAKYPDEVDPRKSLQMARDAVKERVREKLRLFKSSGRIDSSGGFASAPSQRRSGELGSVE